MEVGAIGALLDLDTRYVLYPSQSRFQHSLVAHSTADYSSLRGQEAKIVPVILRKASWIQESGLEP
jgi:hypothetical protein